MTRQSDTRVTQLSNGDVHELLVEVYADLRAASVDEVKQQLAQEGEDMVIKSQWATAVIAKLESRLGVRLVDQDSLSEVEHATFRSLARMVQRQLGILDGHSPSGGELEG